MTEAEFFQTAVAVLRACDGMSPEQVREVAARAARDLAACEGVGTRDAPAAGVELLVTPTPAIATPPRRARVRWRRGDLSGIYYNRVATVDKVRVGLVSPADPDRMALPGWAAYLVDATGALHSVGLYADLRTAMAVVDARAGGPPTALPHGSPVPAPPHDPGRRRVLRPTHNVGPVVYCGVCGSELDEADLI